MKDFVIILDSGCELPEEFQREEDIIVVQGHLIRNDGVEFRACQHWGGDFERETYYAEIKKNPERYSTAPANDTEFYEIFEKYVKEGKEILSISLSTGISGVFDFVTIAKKRILQKYPDARIECVDSLRFGPGFGLLALYAARMRKEGKSLDEVKDYLEKNKNRFHQMGWLDDLSFVAKKGRMTHAKAFMGSLIGIKPIGEFDYNGLTTVIGKVKGEKAAYQAMLGYIAETIEDPEDQIIFITQTNRLRQAEAYKAMIEERFHPKEVYINDVYPTCGNNIGPGLMAAYYYGKPISEGLTEEKAILAKYTGEK